MRGTLIRTGSRSVDFTDNVGHTSFVPQEGSEMDRLVGVIFGKALHLTPVPATALAGQEAQRPMPRSWELAVRLERKETFSACYRDSLIPTQGPMPILFLPWNMNIMYIQDILHSRYYSQYQLFGFWIPLWCYKNIILMPQLCPSYISSTSPLFQAYFKTSPSPTLVREPHKL